MELKNIKYIIASIMAALSFAGFAQDNGDIIVTNDGEGLKVYNLDYSPADYCYYTTEPNSKDLKRIKKTDVLIIKLANGTKVDLSNIQNPKKIPTRLENPGKHPAVTHKALSEIKSGKKFGVIDGNGQELTMKVLSSQNRTLTVTKPRKGLEYNRANYIIPEYVEADGTIYTVVAIDKNAFKNIGIWANDNDIKDIVLPVTLKEIGDCAFAGREGISRIIIPDSVEKIGSSAFAFCGRQSPMFEQIYIPETVKSIGADAFRFVSSTTSYRGYFQGYLSSIPPYITTGNCTYVGIDEEAVEAYMNKNRQQ